jgi:diguanylate cyclase (GGDEF)-like protein
MIDDETGLKNERAFINDCLSYMHIAKRYNHGLELMVIGFRFQAEIERILGKNKMDELIKNISVVLQEHLRQEDLVYIIDKKKVLWSVLFMTNDVASMKIVHNRVKEKISQIDMSNIIKINKVDIKMQLGSANYNENIESPLEFIEIAKKEMEYDV